MQKYFDYVIDTEGRPLQGLLVAVTNAETGDKTIYSDNGVTVSANPLTTDMSGQFGFYAPDGKYDLVISGAGITTVTISDVGLVDGAGIVENAEAIKVLQSQINDNIPVLPTDVFSMSIAENTTIASVSPLVNSTFVRWQIVVDDTTTPSGVGWTPGSVVTATYDVGDYDAHLYYMYIQEEDDTITKIAIDPDLSDGATIEGLSLQAIDTLAPLWTAGAFATSPGADPLTQIILSISPAPVDSGSGLLRYDLHKTIDDGLVLTGIVNNQTVSNLTPNTQYSWYLKAYDNSLNISNSNSYTRTTDSVSDAGTVNLDAVSFEQTQATTPLEIGLTRSGGSTGAIAVTVSTIDRTATAGTNYTAKVSEQVDFADGVTTATVDVVLAASPVLTTNDMFEIQIDYGSEDTGAVTCTIGATNSALCKILSSGAGVEGYTQESSGDYKVIIETDAANATFVNAIKTSNTNEAFAVSGTNSRLSPEGGSGKQVKPNNADSHGDFGDVTTIEANGPYISYPINFTQVGDHTINARCIRNTATQETIHFALERELVSIGADGTGASAGGNSQLITLAADHGMVAGDEVFFVGTSVADYQYTAGASTSFTVTDAPNTDEIEIADTGLGEVVDASDSVCFGEDRSIGLHSGDIGEAPSQIASGWRWTSTNAGGTPREFYIGAAGSYNLRMYEQDYQAAPDKIAIALTSASYNPNVGNDTLNPTLDDKYGDTQSAYSSGSVSDNPDNPTEPTEPMPAGSIAGTLSPADGDDNVPSTGLVVQAEFAGTELTYSIFEVSIGGDPISGTISTALPGIISFTASGSQPNNTLVTVTLEGTVRDTSYELKSFSYTGTDWQFTTINADAAATLFYLDFSDYDQTTSPYIYTETNIISDWNVGKHGYADSWIVGPNKGNTHIADDPDPAGTHGKVFRVRAEGGGVTVGQAVSIACDFGTSTPYAGTGPQDVYFSYDLFIASDHDFTFAQKNCALFTGTRTEATHGDSTPTPEGVLAFVTFQSTYDHTAWPLLTDEGEFSIFYYDANNVQLDDWWDTVDPDDTNKTTNGYQQARGRWITIEMRVGMNSTGTADGPLQVWVTDPARWAGAKQVLNRLHKWQDTTGNMSVDRLWMQLYYGGNETSPVNKPAQTQYHYYDNFIISTNPITHT